jgi:hypothetical protein
MPERQMKYSVPLSRNAEAILAALQTYQQKNRMSRKVYRPGRVFKKTLTYKDTIKLAKLKCAPIRIGIYLGEIARPCVENDLPPLNALVVNGQTRKPGGNYIGSKGSTWEMDLLAALTFRYPDMVGQYKNSAQE